MPSVFYYCALTLLLTHEMDAVKHSEWHLLFILRQLPEAIAYPVFLLLHVPLIFAILWFSKHRNAVIKKMTQYVFAVFLLVHALLHFRLRNDPAYEFSAWSSDSLIYGAAVFAALFIYASCKKKQ